MSKSGQAYIAKTMGTRYTLYSVMKSLDLPLSEEQEKFQAHLESEYPAVVDADDPSEGNSE